MAEQTASTPVLVGMGNPLLDISAHVPMSFCEKYGVKMNDAILAAEEHVPMYKEMIESFEVEYIAGGATQNTIRVCQWMSGQAGSTAYIGCVGNDDFGSKLQTSAENDGVQVAYLKDETIPTGTCAVLINEKERSLVANLSAANAYKIDHLHTEEIQTIINGAKFFYSAGFFLTVCPEAMVEVGQHAAEHGKIYAMNLAAPFLCSVFKDAMHKVLPFTDFVFGNESEAEAFAEANGFAGASIEEIALKISALPKANGTRGRVVVITQGSRPTIVAMNGRISSFSVPALDQAAIVDLNGAGDAFVGGFFSQLIKGETIQACVDAGNYAARTIIQRSGCTLPDVCDFTPTKSD